MVAKAPTFKEIHQEFDESLGYIRQDIRWLLDKNSRLQYTVALLTGCGCEMLAACGDKFRRGENEFADFLPSGHWLILSKRIYAALRDGLAHGFDTKHIGVDGKEYQIFFEWDRPEVIKIQKDMAGVRVVIGTCALARKLCGKIDQFEVLLRSDEAARKLFVKARQNPAILSAAECEAWRSLVASA